MTSLSFPDVNLWLALLHSDHPHAESALHWWNHEPSEIIGFSRLTQLSLLRLLTNSAVMNCLPLTMAAAWQRYDSLYQNGRVGFFAEPAGIEEQLRAYSSFSTASPKLWADSYLLAFAEQAHGTLVTFDASLAQRSSHCLLLT